MSYAIPTVDSFKQQFARDFPYAVPAFGASAVAAVSGGLVTGVSISEGGQGYAIPPTVTITAAPGDQGSGAIATAVLGTGKNAGQVYSLTVTTPGSGYLLPPIITFSGGAGDDTNLGLITDEDIEGAIEDAQFNVNPGLFGTEAAFQRAFNYLAAHQLVEKVKMWGAGVQSQYSWVTAAKSVGGVSQSFIIPEWIKEMPFLAHIGTTRYGAMYLQIITPLLVANVQSACTFTNP